MHLTSTMIPHPRLDVRGFRRSTHPVARGARWTSFHVPGTHTTGWPLLLVVLAVPLVLQVPGASRLPVRDGLSLALVVLVAQLPLLVVAAVQLGRRRARHEAELREIHELECRVSRAEGTVLRDEEKLHELRATISGIAMVHRMLRERRSDLPAPTRTRLERLHESELERLQRLLADRHAQPAGPLEVATIVEPYVESLRCRGHRVSWGDARARAWGRPDDVAEIVNILLDNAVRHAPGAEISLAVDPGRDQVELTVADTGPGIAPEVASHVFERGARSSGSAGQGIGLDRAQRLATSMGGTLRLREDAAQGAAFVLTLPVAPRTGTEGQLCLAHSG